MSWTISLKNQSCSRRRCSQGTPRWCHSRKSKTWCRNATFSRRNSRIEPSSCRCTTTLTGDEKTNEENCLQNSLTVAGYAARFPKGHWSLLGLGSEETGLLHPLTNWMFVEHSRWRNDDISRRKRAYWRVLHPEDLWKSKGGGRTSNNYNAASTTTELSHAAHSPRGTGNPIAIVDNDFRVSSPIRGRIETNQTTHVHCGSRTKLGAAAQRESRKPCRRSSSNQSLRWRWLEKKCLTWTTLRYNSRRSVGRILLLELMSRVFTSSKWSQIRTRRSYSRQHQNWSSIGGQGHETLCPLCNWNQDRFCVKKNGTQSWIVISRSVSKYVTELLEEHKKPIHFKRTVIKHGKLVAMKRKE